MVSPSHLLLHSGSGTTTQNQKLGCHFDSALFLIPTPNQVTTSFPFCLVSMSLIQLFLSITPVHTLAEATALSHLDYCIRLQTENPALAPPHCDQTL